MEKINIIFLFVIIMVLLIIIIYGKNIGKMKTPIISEFGAIPINKTLNNTEFTFFLITFYPHHNVTYWLCYDYDNSSDICKNETTGIYAPKSRPGSEGYIEFSERIIGTYKYPLVHGINIYLVKLRVEGIVKDLYVHRDSEIYLKAGQAVFDEKILELNFTVIDPNEVGKVCYKDSECAIGLFCLRTGPNATDITTSGYCSVYYPD
jgi:hypothetical protein